MFNYELLVQVKVFIVIEWVVIENIQVGKLFKKTNFMKLNSITLDVRMPKVWSFIGLKVTKLFQEPRNLDDNSENVFIRGMIMHWKPLNSLIVFNDRIKSFFL